MTCATPPASNGQSTPPLPQQPEQRIPGKADGKAHGVRPPHTDRHRQQMHGKEPEAEPDQRRQHMRGDACGCRPADERCRMMKNEPMATGKNAKTPEKYEPIELLAAVTASTQSVTTPARQARSAPGHRHTLDGTGNAIAARRDNRDRIDDGVQYDRARCAPLHQPQQEHGDQATPETRRPGSAAGRVFAPEPHSSARTTRRPRWRSGCRPHSAI